MCPGAIRAVTLPTIVSSYGSTTNGSPPSGRVRSSKRTQTVFGLVVNSKK